MERHRPATVRVLPECARPSRSWAYPGAAGYPFRSGTTSLDPVVTALLRSSAVPAQFARFVLAGGTANLAYAASFLLLADLGTQAANVVGSLASAAVANELHRRLTFRAGARVGWRTAQLQGGATAGAGLAASSAALALLESATDAGGLTALVVAAAVSGAVGLARFVLLRWLFTRRAGGALAPVVPLRLDAAAGAPAHPAALSAAA